MRTTPLLRLEIITDKVQKPPVRNLSFRDQAGKYDINMEHTRLNLAGDRNLAGFQFFYDLYGLIVQHFVGPDGEKHRREVVIISEYRGDIRRFAVCISNKTEILAMEHFLAAFFAQNFALIPKHDIFSKIVMETPGASGHVGPGRNAEGGPRHWHSKIPEL